MTRKEIESTNVEKISNLNVSRVEEIYKDIGAALECNDGKAKVIVWEV